MLKTFKRIIALISCFSMVVCLICTPAFASGSSILPLSEIVGFGDWLIERSVDAGHLIQSLFDEDACPSAPTLVANHSYVEQNVTTDGELVCRYVCEYCGLNAGEVLETAYNEYVVTLPDATYHSESSYLLKTMDSGRVDNFTLSPQTVTDSWGSLTQYRDDYTFITDAILSNSPPNNQASLQSFYFWFKVPISGTYYLASNNFPFASALNGEMKCYYLNGNTEVSHFEISSAVGGANFSNYFVALDGSDYIRDIHQLSGRTKNAYYFDSSITYYLCMNGVYLDYLNPSYNMSGAPFQITYGPISLVPVGGAQIPLDATTRTGSLSGDYGIVGDDGTIIKSDTQYIVDETNNTVYNPVTNTTSNVTDWTYDYSDRSYHVTLDDGTTQTITYGDEFITIQEGDTVYSVYYITSGSGSGSGEGGETGDACKHDYASTVDKLPTCTAAGSETFTCSLCGDTYSDKIPADGHTWQVLQTVQTSYDENGELVQQGYTIYQCAICGEQYKDTEGTGPPEAEEEKSIWEKIGDFFGDIGGGLLTIIETIFGKLLDGLNSLANMILEKLNGVVETVLKLFDEIPRLFSGFLDFLAAVFPFIPEEIMLVLTFGIVAIVFIGIIKLIIGK